MGVRWPVEIRRDVVALVHSGLSAADVCRDFGIPHPTVSLWMMNANAEDNDDSDVVLSAAQARRLKKLEKENLLLRQETEVLRRAIEFLSRGAPPK